MFWLHSLVGPGICVNFNYVNFYVGIIKGEGNNLLKIAYHFLATNKNIDSPLSEPFGRHH